MEFDLIVNAHRLIYTQNRENKSSEQVQNMSNDEKNPKNDPINGPWGSSSNHPKGDKPNPWGSDNKGKPKGPFESPEANKTFELLQQRLKESFGGGGGGNGGNGSGGQNPPQIPFDFPNNSMILGIGVIIAALWLGSGFFRVQENELGVVTRFGKFERVVSAGLRYHIPFPVESIEIRDITLKDISGTTKVDKASDSDPSLILTGDENMVHCNYTVRWKVKDISDFLFMARNPESTIKAAANSVTREIVGQATARSVLTEKRDEIEGQARALLQKLMDQYKLGVEIVAFQLMDVAPPREVIDSYNDVQASLVDAEQEVNKAESYRNDILPRARGAATQILQDAEAYRDSKVAEAEGEAARFKQVYEAYAKNKSIAVIRYYLDSMQKVLSQTNKIIFDPKVGQGVLPYLPINDLKNKSNGEKK